MDVCEGLKYLHEQPKQIVHRDIKPSNILLDENDDAKVIISYLLKFHIIYSQSRI